MSRFAIRAIVEDDLPLVTQLLSSRWFSTRILTRERLVDAATLPGFVAEDEDNAIWGVLTFERGVTAWEIVTLDSFLEGQGIGSTLLETFLEAARAQGCEGVWLVTSNDNLQAVRFYQKRGFRLVAVHPDALTRGRQLKPELPLLGLEDIPIQDELELRLKLRETT